MRKTKHASAHRTSISFATFQRIVGERQFYFLIMELPNERLRVYRV